MIGISEKSINLKTTLPIKIIYCGNSEFIMFYRKFSPVICKHFLLMKPFTVDPYQEVGYIKQTKTAALHQSWSCILLLTSAGPLALRGIKGHTLFDSRDSGQGLYSSWDNRAPASLFIVSFLTTKKVLI